MRDNEVVHKNFIGVDFHVHTPASHCYKGLKEESEYIEIIRRYSKKSIKVMAITDHNTIKGYKTLIRLKSDMQDKIKVLSQFIDKHPELVEDFNRIKSDLEILESMLILPGVEFEANPGIHLLLIFQPECDLSKIEAFLEDSGYPEEVQGKEETDNICKLDVIQVLEKANELGCIVIAPHADSNKGIYEKLDGKYRSVVFRSEQLIAVSYNNPNCYVKMKAMEKNKEYQREIPLAFIQSSDYHGGPDEPGFKIVYLDLESLTFEAICTALRNRNEKVSLVKNPKIINILNEIINDSRSVSFKNFETQEEQNEIKKMACALLNIKFGILVIGVSAKQEVNIIGLNKEKESCIQIIESILSKIKPFVRYETSFFKCDASRHVMVVYLFSTNNTIYFLENDEVYFLKNKSAVKANLEYIQNVIEDSLVKRMVKYENINRSKIDVLIKELSLLTKNAQEFHLINKIERGAYKLFEIGMAKTIFKKDIVINKKIINGNYEGRLYYIEKSDPRLQYAYLRCSCPKLNESIDNKLIKKFQGEAIVITPGGGCYCINQIGEWGIVCLDDLKPALVISLRDGMSKLFSAASIVGWLKSSLFTWYSYIALGDIDIHTPSIANNVFIPPLECLKPENAVENIINDIMEKENNLLHKANLGKYTSDELQEMLDEHNLSIDKIAYQIDKLIFEELEVNEQEQELLQEFFNVRKIYNIIPSIEKNENNKNLMIEAAITSD